MGTTLWSDILPPLFVMFLFSNIAKFRGKSKKNSLKKNNYGRIRAYSPFTLLLIE
jgi:hypothetical protein